MKISSTVTEIKFQILTVTFKRVKTLRNLETDYEFSFKPMRRTAYDK